MENEPHRETLNRLIWLKPPDSPGKPGYYGRPALSGQSSRAEMGTGHRQGSEAYPTRVFRIFLSSIRTATSLPDQVFPWGLGTSAHEQFHARKHSPRTLHSLQENLKSQRRP